MFKLAFAALLIGAASTASSLPLCHVTALSDPVPGLSDLFIGVPFRYITVTAQVDCLPARVALTNYGGRSSGEPLTLNPGESIRFGPVPLYRRLGWLAASGLSYDVPIHPRRAP